MFLMPLDFPDNPTLDQEFSANGKTWYWTGSTWDSVIAATGGSSSTDLGTFYGFKYIPVTGQLTLETIDDGETEVVLPDQNRRSTDYREWVFTTRPLDFYWSETEKNNLIVRVE